MTPSLKVTVKPLGGVTGEIFEKVTSMYNANIVDTIERLGKGLSAKTIRKSSVDLYFVPENLDDITKAINASGKEHAKPGKGSSEKYERPPEGVKNPGAKGGKFYRTKSGKIRYGTPNPNDYDRDASHTEIAEHFEHYRPSPLAGGEAHKKIMRAVMKTGIFDENDKAFLDWWDGALGEFKDWTGFTDEELSGDLSDTVLTVDGVDLTYQQAVHDFLMDQDWGDQPAEEVESAVKDLLEKYQKALQDPAVNKIAAEQAAAIEKSLYGWFSNAETLSDEYKPIGAKVLGNVGDWQHDMIAALGEGGLGLIFKPTSKHKAGAFKGVIAPNAGWLEESGNAGYLLGTGAQELDRLSTEQLMSVYVASKLNAAWEPESRSYTTDDVSSLKTKLGARVAKMLAKRLFGSEDVNDPKAKSLLKTLDDGTSYIGTKFSDANNGKDTSGFVQKLTDLKVSKDADAEIQKLAEQAAHFQKIKDAALAAQEDTKWSAPKTMGSGMWGGKKINPVTGQPYKPFLHQIKSINWMSTVKRGLLALDAGMGKTGTVIAFSEKRRQEGSSKRSILFLPPSLMAQWPGEIASFAPDSAKPGDILNLAGLSMEERKIALQSDMAQNAKYILLSTGTLNKKGDHSELAEGEDPEEGSDDELVGILKNLEGDVFIDEVHQGGYKTPTGTRHQMAKEVIGDRDCAFGLTATPMPNAPLDTFHLTNLFAPGSVGTAEEWSGKMHGVMFDSDTKQWLVARPENIVEMNQRLKPFCFYKGILDDDVVADMGPQMPELSSNAVDLTMSTVRCPNTGLSQLDYATKVVPKIVAKKLEEIEERRAKQGRDPLRNPAMVAAAIGMGLNRQIAISPGLIDKRYKGPSPKIDEIVKRVKDHFSGDAGREDKPIVLFSSFPKKAFPLLKQAFMDAGIDPSGLGIISGEKNAQERAFLQDMTNGYTNDKGEFVPGKIKVLMVGTLSGGAGLNLQKKASYMQFLDEPWNPAAKRQALGRVWRPGRKDKIPVRADTFRVVGAEDTRIEGKLATKQTMATALLGKPDMDAFSANAASDITKLTGHLAPSSLSEEQLAQQMSAMESGLNIDDDEFFGEGLGGFDENDIGSTVKKMDSYTKESMTDKQAKQKVALGKVAPNLVHEVDMSGEQSKWTAMMDKRGAQQRYEVKMMVAATHDKAGNKDKADAARKSAERIKQAYPDVFGTVKAEPTQVKDSNTVSKTKHTENAVTLNGGGTALDKPKRLTYGAAQYVVKNKGAFATAEREAAAKVVAAAEKAGVGSDSWMLSWRIGDPVAAQPKTKMSAKAAEKKPEPPAKASKEVKTEAPKAKPAATKATHSLNKENPFNKKEDPISHAAYMHLAGKTFTDEASYNDAVDDFVRKRSQGKTALFNIDSEKLHKQTVAAIRKHLLKERAVLTKSMWLPLWLGGF